MLQKKKWRDILPVGVQPTSENSNNVGLTTGVLVTTHDDFEARGVAKWTKTIIIT